MIIRTAILLVMIALGLAVQGGAAVAQSEPLVPAAPLCMAAGKGVSIAWSLPSGPRAQLAVIYRADKQTAAYDEVGRADASALAWTDETVELGKVYLYRVSLTRGATRSPMSDAAEVQVGGTSRVVLRGGSIQRAVFEVTLFKGGRRLTQVFVHSVGEAVGDLAHVPELGVVQDFRLGLTLRELALSRARGEESSLEELKDASGQPLRDAGGQPIKLDFRFPGQDRAVLTAALALKDGRVISLVEGAAFVVP
ncbi:MAG: hypothetical protein KF754_01430 [Planctomycetes bacterium]|nr:hypothetical protein [Planctomycetota bacterium]